MHIFPFVLAQHLVLNTLTEGIFNFVNSLKNTELDICNKINIYILD